MLLRRQLLSYLVAPLALLTVGSGRPIDRPRHAIVMVDGWILRRSDLEGHG